MRFICAACGKTLDLEGEEARFCPFCGRAYAAAVMDGARADAVQAKYWQMTRAAYGTALRDMAVTFLKAPDADVQTDIS